MKKRSKYRLLPVGIPVLIILVLVAVWMGTGKDETEQAREAGPAVEGVTYLKTLESRDPDEVEAVVKQLRAERLKREREERLRELTEGLVPVWSLFEDYVLIGDSRTVNFSACGFMPAERVLAEVGVNLSYVERVIEELEHLNPARVFLCFGVNDMEMHPDDIPGFCEDYRQAVDRIRSVCPEAEIYINSVPGVTEAAAAASRVLGKIPQYNEALKALCGQIDCRYVDNDMLYEAHRDLYEVDGIHFRIDMYPLWGANMIMAMYDAQTQQAAEASDA